MEILDQISENLTVSHSLYQSCPWVGSTRGSGRVGLWKLASAVGRVGSGRVQSLCVSIFVMSRYFEGIYGMAVDNCIIILDG